MNKLAIITTMYNFVRSKGLAFQQQDVAAQMRSTPGTVSRALRGEPKALTDSFIRRFNEAYGNIFNVEWTKTGEGNMLAERGVNMLGDINVGDISNSSHVAVGHGSISEGVLERPDVAIPGGTAPVIPVKMMSMGCDIVEAINKMEDVQRMYRGDLDIDAYILVTDDALLPEYSPMDYIGIKAYRPKESIIPGNLYAVNTKSNGMVVRYLRYDEKGDFVAYTRSESYQPFTIKRSDIIRVYRKIIMFRY